MQCISVVFPFLFRRENDSNTLRVNGFLILLFFFFFFEKKKKREENGEKTLRFKKYLKTCERSVNDTVNVIWNTDRRPVYVASSTDLCFGAIFAPKRFKQTWKDCSR